MPCGACEPSIEQIEEELNEFIRICKSNDYSYDARVKYRAYGKKYGVTSSRDAEEKLYLLKQDMGYIASS